MLISRPSQTRPDPKQLCTPPSKPAPAPQLSLHHRTAPYGVNPLGRKQPHYGGAPSPATAAAAAAEIASAWLYLLHVVLQLGHQVAELLHLLGLAHVHQPVLELQHKAAQQLAVDLQTTLIYIYFSNFIALLFYEIVLSGLADMSTSRSSNSSTKPPSSLRSTWGECTHDSQHTGSYDCKRSVGIRRPPTPPPPILPSPRPRTSHVPSIAPGVHQPPWRPTPFSFMTSLKLEAGLHRPACAPHPKRPRPANTHPANTQPPPRTHLPLHDQLEPTIPVHPVW